MGEHDSRPVTPAEVVQACQAAERAARAAGVVLNEVVGPGETDAIGDLFDRIWGVPAGAPVLATEVLRVYALTGQYLALALDAGDSEPLAASVGLLSAPLGTTLHSHITGALPHAQGRSVGYALKLHQRAWALRRGLSLITWTYDPLLRRNAWFNLTKLGARAVRYLPDFYGAMPDAVNAGDLSDRLYLQWRLTSAPVVAACAGGPTPPGRRVDSATLHERGYRVLLGADPDGVGRHPARLAGSGIPGPPHPPGLLVAMPEGIETLRRERPDLARQWRLAVRRALTAALDGGWRVGGVTTDGHYVVEPVDAPGRRT